MYHPQRCLTISLQFDPSLKSLLLKLRKLGNKNESKMRLIPVLGFLLTAVEGLRTGRGSPLLRPGISKHINKVGKSTAAVFPDPQDKPFPKHNFLNANSTKFAVNGTAIPDVDFDVGESYAGSPMSKATSSFGSSPRQTKQRIRRF